MVPHWALNCKVYGKLRVAILVFLGLREFVDLGFAVTKPGNPASRDSEHHTVDSIATNTHGKHSVQPFLVFIRSWLY